jgi:hypothetical protein
MYANNLSRLNQPTLDLLSDNDLLRKVASDLSIGASINSIARRHRLSWRQADILVRHLERKGVVV